MIGPSQPDVLGSALMDYYREKTDEPLILHNSYGDPEEMPLEVFFEAEDQLSELDQYALSLCRGSVLDVGAGAGKHSLILQNKRKNVTALDNSPGSIKVMEARGVRQVIEADIYSYERESYDTILLLMNGIGLAGNLQRLPILLGKFKALLNPGGQVICDSSDISYLFSPTSDQSGHYYGEISYAFEYQNQRGRWFDWLYADQDTLLRCCHEGGFLTQIVYENEEDEFLVRMIKKY